MADIKTHLRELSVALGIKGQKAQDCEKITPEDFINRAREVIENDISPAQNILSLTNFNREYQMILLNGNRLGRRIVELGLVNPKEAIVWSGGDTQKDDPIDLSIGTIGFSLKEDSYILENMGLYKYVNLLTGSEFPRGLHVFKYFANREYEEWFKYTWDTFVAQLSKSPWIDSTGRYVSELRNHNSQIYFLINGCVASIIPAKSINFSQYMRLTTGVAREKVFAKWISSELSQDREYLALKHNCSDTAGKHLCSYINTKLELNNVSRLLQIYKTEYYYAKSTETEMAIFHIPGVDTYSREIEIQKIEYSVPTSQLNIYTTIRNIKSDNSLVLRNECRFSHGQFNGTPEAKMYYERGHDLSVIYNRIV